MTDANTVRLDTNKTASQEALAHLEKALALLDVSSPHSAAVARLHELIENLQEGVQAS